MHIYIRVCTYVCMYVCTHKSIHTYIHTHAGSKDTKKASHDTYHTYVCYRMTHIIHTYIYVCMYMYIYIFVKSTKNRRGPSYMHVYPYIHTYKQAYIESSEHNRRSCLCAYMYVEYKRYMHGYV